jgi:hypothetical protein
VKGCGCRPVTNVATGSWAGVRKPSHITSISGLIERTAIEG